MLFFFVPGRIPSLSCAELNNWLDLNNISFETVFKDGSILIYDIDASEKKMNSAFNRFGGFIKYGVVIDDPLEYLKRYQSEAKCKKDKVSFSISFYLDKPDALKLREKNLLGAQLKSVLKENDFRARYVTNSKDLVTSTVLLLKNKVLENGFELNYWRKGNNKVFWGVTGGIQDFEGFSERDYNRPRNNKFKGMLPPKLARIMLNLSNCNKNCTVWDPFCGSGSVLQEGLMLGYRVIGSDIDEVSVEETTENLDWLTKKYDLKHAEYKVFQHDIKSGVPEGIDFDAIVTEPYLGPVRREVLSEAEIQESFNEVSPVYESIFNAVLSSKNTKTPKRLVIVVPSFRTHNGWKTLKILSKGQNFKDITQNLSAENLHWERPHSIIRRNIKIFEF